MTERKSFIASKKLLTLSELLVLPPAKDHLGL